MYLGARPAPAGNGGPSARERQARGRQCPSVAGARQHCGLVQHQCAVARSIRALSVRSDREKPLRTSTKSKAAPRRPAIAARTWPVPFTSFALAVSRASVSPPTWRPRASTTPSSVVLPSSRITLPSSRPARTATAPGSLAPLARKVRLDLLRIADGREAERPIEPSAGDVQCARETAGIGAKVPVRSRAIDVERGDGDDRALRPSEGGSVRCS